MKKNALTTIALAASVRKPLPPPSRPFKAKHRQKRGDWKREVARD